MRMVTGMSVLVAAYVPKGVLLEQASAQSSKGVDSWTLAQQAYARFDYANAYRFALEALKASPQNTDARRVAAKSAREMHRYSDCLKLMNEVQAAQANLDDVGLVGECSSESSFSPWALSFLQKNTASETNRDVASYWLGCYYYARGDYPRAEKLLTNVSLLPERLDKDRVFKLGRLRDLVRATQSSTPPKKEEPGAREPKTPVAKDPPPSAGTQSMPPVVRKSAARSRAVIGASRDGNVATANGWFATPSAALQSGVAIIRGKATPLGPDDQAAYEATVLRQGSTNAAGSIESKNISVDDIFADSKVSGTAGYQTAPSERGSQFKAFAEIALSATFSKIYRPFYTPLFEYAKASEAARMPSRGWSTSLSMVTDYAVNSNFGGQAFVGIGQYYPSTRENHAAGRAGYSLRIGFEEYDLRGGYTIEREQGKDGQVASYDEQISLDFQVGKIFGLFSFAAPPGYSLVRYSRYKPEGSSSIITYTMLEGRYWEFNFAPRVHFTDTLSLVTWYRYVIGSNRSYVSPTKASDVRENGRKTGSWFAFRPTADFESTSSDWLVEAEWTALRTPPMLGVSGTPLVASVAGGLMMRRVATRYVENKLNNLNYYVLLDRAGENTVRTFVEARVQF